MGTKRNLPEHLQHFLDRVPGDPDTGLVRVFEHDRDYQIPTIYSTGAAALDVALGVGGVPGGRIVEIFGPEMGGKSSLAFSIASQAQRTAPEDRGFVLLVDAEHSFSPEFASHTFGIDLRKLVLAQPVDGPGALELLTDGAASGAFDVLILDSVAALDPGVTGGQLGVHAKMMSEGIRRLVPRAAQGDGVVLFVNQIRMNPTQYGNPETTTGGRALGFYASMRLEVRSPASKRITTGGDVTGQVCQVKVRKNKLAPPHRETQYTLDYRRGIDTWGSLLDAGEALGLVERRGAVYLGPGGVKLGFGREAATTALREDPRLLDRLWTGIYDTFPGPVRAARPEARRDQTG